VSLFNITATRYKPLLDFERAFTRPLSLIMVSEKTRKVRSNVKPAKNSKPKGPHKNKSKSLTSAKPPTKKDHLTNYDWLQVINYMKDNPGVLQNDVVRHFATKEKGALHFTQGALSKKWNKREKLLAMPLDDPTVLARKRLEQVVTRPDVDKALFTWHQSMEAKGESVTGPMLKEKRRRFEELFNVPEEERLKGGGWLTSFKEQCVPCSSMDQTYSNH
jgi:hypothetical protein